MGKGKDEIYSYLRSAFFQLVRPTFWWVSEEEGSPNELQGTELCDAFWANTAQYMSEYRWGEVQLSTERCLVPLEMFLATRGVCSGCLGRSRPFWSGSWRLAQLPKGVSGGISPFIWVTESIPQKLHILLQTWCFAYAIYSYSKNL